MNNIFSGKNNGKLKGGLISRVEIAPKRACEAEFEHIFLFCFFMFFIYLYTQKQEGKISFCNGSCQENQ